MSADVSTEVLRELILKAGVGSVSRESGVPRSTLYSFAKDPVKTLRTDTADKVVAALCRMAVLQPIDPTLETIITSWAKLSDAQKAALSTLVSGLLE